MKTSMSISIVSIFLFSCYSRNDYAGIWVYDQQPNVTMEIFSDMTVSFPPIFPQTLVISNTQTEEIIQIIEHAGNCFGFITENVFLSGTIDLKNNILTVGDTFQQYKYRIQFFSSSELILRDEYDTFSFGRYRSK